MQKVNSPVAPNYKAFQVEVFETEKLLNQYNQLGLNVSRFFKKDKFGLYECEKTGYRFYHPSTMIGDARFYEELSQLRSNYYSERWEHLESLSYFNKNDKVLEIGSGFGKFLRMLKEIGIEGKGIELNPKAVEYCKQINLDVEQILIENFSPDHLKKNDVICSFQVLEHVYDVHSFIQNQLELLKTGGKLIIGVPNNNPFLFINDKYHTLNLPPHHAGLWNRKSLKSLEKIFPIQVEKIIVEPLDLSYDYFIQHQKQYQKKILRKGINIAQKLFPSVLKEITCRIFSGRNILVIFKKIE